MKSTRQGTQGFEGGETPTLQQIMEAIRVLQEKSEEYKREQEQIQEEAVAEQERLREEIRLNQARLMAEIEASRRVMEEHTQANEELRRANEELRRDMHCHGRQPTREHSSDLSSRYDPNSFSQQIIEELVPPHYITPKIAFFRV